MINFETAVKHAYTPIIQEYGFHFAELNDHEFFLINDGFALWVFIDPKDYRSDVWYVSINDNREILVHSLMFVMEERYDKRYTSFFGQPKTFMERISAYLNTHAKWLANECQDILSGNETWLQGYPSQGDYSRHVAKFLAPYFRVQGYPIVLRKEG